MAGKSNMNISIFSKFDMAGGSEFRCVELANGIAKYTGYKANLLAERKFPKKLRSHVVDSVTVIEDCFSQPDYFYESDFIVVINTDAREFSTLDYWMGKSQRHSDSLDMEKMRGKTMCFLYNFLVSPCRNLKQLYEYDIDLKIITTNKKFFDEITKQDRYEDVRIIPRYTLESPIDPDKLNIFVREPSDTICFGMHSKRLDNKWNDEILKLIKEVNGRYNIKNAEPGEDKGDKVDSVKFRFMGIKEGLRNKVSSFDNVVAMKEDSESVRDFLSNIDVFLFFPDWKREEPWARVIAEAMVSGCPVIALNKGGTSDQILKYNNGMLCKNYKDYYKTVINFIEHKEIIPHMSSNSIRISRSFYSEAVIRRLMGILNNG